MFPERKLIDLKLAKLRKELSFTLNFGIVGCGTIAEFYASAIEDIDGSRISDVFDVNPQSGEQFAEKVGAKYHSTYESMLESPVDAVCICTPSGLHAGQVVQALSLIHISVIFPPVPAATPLNAIRNMRWNLWMNSRTGSSMQGIISTTCTRN